MAITLSTVFTTYAKCSPFWAGAACNKDAGLSYRPASTTPVTFYAYAEAHRDFCHQPNGKQLSGRVDNIDLASVFFDWTLKSCSCKGRVRSAAQLCGLVKQYRKIGPNCDKLKTDIASFESAIASLDFTDFNPVDSCVSHRLIGICDTYFTDVSNSGGQSGVSNKAFTSCGVPFVTVAHDEWANYST